MITKKTRSITPTKAITGTAPQPGTTFPCPELPMDLRRLPNAVFCPMTVLRPQFLYESRYCMRDTPLTTFLSKVLMQTSSPALSMAIFLLLILFGLTGFGIYTSFGPPAKQLDDPFDDHDD